MQLGIAKVNYRLYHFIYVCLLFLEVGWPDYLGSDFSMYHCYVIYPPGLKNSHELFYYVVSRFLKIECIHFMHLDHSWVIHLYYKSHVMSGIIRNQHNLLQDSLFCVALHCIALFYIVLYCIALHCIALHCIVLYFQSHVMSGIIRGQHNL